MKNFVKEPEVQSSKSEMVTGSERGRNSNWCNGTPDFAKKLEEVFTHSGSKRVTKFTLHI